MPESPKADRSKKTSRRPRRWGRRLAITGVVLLGLALFVIGPGSRWIIKTIVTRQLEKQGLTGDFEISGRLLSGYTLEKVSFHGSGLIRSLQAGELAVDYRILRIIDKKVDRLSGRDISIVLHPEPKPEKAKDPDAPLEIDIPEATIQSARELALPVSLAFGTVAVEIQRDELPSLQFQIHGLAHRAGEDTFRISGGSSNVLGERGFHGQDIEIGWAADTLTLSRLDVLPAVSLEAFRLDMPAGRPAKFSAVAKLAGASVALEADETGTARLTLTDKALELQDLIAELPIELDLSGTLTALVLNVEHLLAPPEQWHGQLKLNATNLQYDRFKLETISAEARITDEQMLELLASLGPEKDVELKIKTTLKNDQGKVSLANHPIEFNLEVDAIDQLAAQIIEVAGNDSSGDPPLLPAGSCRVSGSLFLDENNRVSNATATWHATDLGYDGKAIPPLQGSAKLAGNALDLDIALANPGAGEHLDLSAKADFEAGTYEAGTRILLPDPAWAAAFIPGTSPLWRPGGPVGIDWNGSGSYKKMTHKGGVAIRQLRLTAPNDSFTTIEAGASYDWPGAVGLDSLLVQNGQLKVSGALSWKDGVLNIPGLDTSDQTGLLMKLSGSAPLALSLRSLEDLFAEEKELDLTFEADKFELSRLRNLVPLGLPEGYTASLETKLRLTGSAAHPKLDGHLQILDLQVPKPAGLPPSTTRLDFATSGDVLTARGTVTEAAGEILKLDAELPLDTRGWARDPRSVNRAAFKAHAVSENFDFARLEKFLPQLAGVKGHLGLDVTADGPASEPKLAGNLAVVIDLLPLPGTPYRQLENTKLLARFEGRRLFLDPSPITLAGGKAILSGEGSLEGEEPTFTVNLDADHVLLWRNDSVSARANAKLQLAGTPAKAALSGSIDIVESLVYKDIEIIPIGLPATSAPKPQLPKIDKARDGPLVKLPAPISEWGLDVKVRTADPILIRGNLATGSILIDATVAGTLANPRPSGTIQLHKIKADLPFSTLEVNRGTLTLRPDAPLDPTLDIRGSSSISKRTIDMRVSGPLSNPKYTLNSNPPLPENEILSLLATGSTSSDLEDTNTASMKAFQLMIEEFRRRSQQPGSNALFKKLMKEFEDVQLQVGEHDQFTGRKFNSATLELSDKYFLTAGVDDKGNTRTTITYSLRFR